MLDVYRDTIYIASAPDFPASEERARRGKKRGVPMFMLQAVFDTICALIGGVVTATAICWLFWSLFKLVRRPEWGPCLAFFLGVVFFHDRIGASFYWQMLLLFSGLYAVGCWFEGSKWRARDKSDKLQRGVSPDF